MGHRKSTRRVCVGLIALFVAISLLGAIRPARALTCVDFSQNFPSGWRVIQGGATVTLGLSETRKAVLGTPATLSNGDPGSVVAVEYQFETTGIYSVDFYWDAGAVTSDSPLEFNATTYFSNQAIEAKGELRDYRGRAGTITFNFSLNRAVNGLVIRYLARGNGAYFAYPQIALGVGEICFQGNPPTPTYDYTYIPSSQTPSFTPSRTPTFTPSPTLTPSETFTPSPTYTVGGPTVTETYTLTGTYTPGPTFENALTGREIPTAVNVDDRLKCLDIANPCNPIAAPVIPPLNMPSPTLIAGLPTLTALPSMTSRAIAMGTATPGTPQGASIGYAATSVGQLIGALDGTPYYTNAEGTPVSGAQGIYEVGSAAGQLFGLARGLTSGQLGRVGSLLTFLLAIIAVNLLIRFAVFGLPIALRLINLFLSFINAILPFAILIIILFAASPAQAQGPTQTYTPTPLPTWTPSPTLIPIPPTPTSIYGGLMTTPTPLSLIANATTRAQFDTRTVGRNLADSAINIYHAMNQAGIANFVSFVAMLLIMIFMLVRIYNKLTNLKE